MAPIRYFYLTRLEKVPRIFLDGLPALTQLYKAPLADALEIMEDNIRQNVPTDLYIAYIAGMELLEVAFQTEPAISSDTEATVVLQNPIPADNIHECGNLPILLRALD